MTRSFAISKPVRILLIIICAALVFCLASVITFKTRWFHGIVQQEVAERLQRLTGTRVQIGELQLQPALFQVTLQRLTLHGTEASSQPPLFTAQTIILRINLLSMLRWRLTVSRCDALGMEVHILTRPEGTTNLPGPRHKPGALVNNLIRLAMGTLDVQRSNLFWNNQKIPLDLTARNVAVLLHYNLSRGYWGSFAFSPLSLKVRGKLLPPVAFATEMEFSRRGLALKRLIWRSLDASGQGVMNLSWQPAVHGEARLQAQGDLGKLARVMGWTPIQGGDLQLQCHAIYQGGKFSASGSMQAHKVLVRSAWLAPQRVDLTSDFSGSQSHLHLAHARVYALDGRFQGGGDFQFRTSRFTAQGQLQGLELAAALRAISAGKTLSQILPLTATISGKAEASGSARTFKSNFDLQFTPPGNPPAALHPVSGFARGSLASMPGLTLNLVQAHLETLHSALTAQGSLGVAQSGLQFHYSTTDFEEIRPLMQRIESFLEPIPLQLKSRATFACTVTGSVLHPGIQGHLSVGAFIYRGWDWQSFEASLRASPERFQIDSARLRSGPSTLSFSGFVNLDDWTVTPHSVLNLTARAQHSPLRGLEDAFDAHYPFTGLATGQLGLTGTVSSMRGSGNLAVVDGGIGDEPFDSLSGQVLIAGSVWSFQKVLLRKGNGRLTGWARLVLPQHAFSMDFHGAQFSLAQLKSLASIPPESGEGAATKQLEGTADFDLQGHGTFSAPQMQFSLNVSDLQLEGSPLGGLHAQFTLQKPRLNGKVQIQGPAGSLQFTSTTEMQGDWPSQLSGQFSSVRLDPWLEWLGYNRGRAPLAASGSLKGNGPLKNLRKFTVQAQARTLTLSLPEFSLKNVQPVDLRYSDRRLDLRPFRMQGPATAVQIQLAAQFGPPAAISLNVSGHSDASVLRLLDPSVQAAGGFGINLHATGTLNQPSLGGQITVQNLSLRYGSLPLPIADLNGTIVLKGNRAIVQTLGEESGESSIQLAGYATIGAHPQFDLRAQLQQLRFEYPTDITSILSGELTLRGSTQGGELGGEITVGQMFVSQNFNLVNWIGQVGSSLGGGPLNVQTSQTSKIRLDVHVTTNPEVRLVSRTLTLVAAMDTTLRGTLASPVVMGDIHIRDGQGLIAGNRYQIKHGDITMTSPFQTTPVLDIEAQTRVDRYDLTIDVTGPMDRAKLAYRSDPPLPTEDILSLLALGYAPQQALMQSTGNQSFAALGASALLSQALSSQVSGRVQQLFGVSRIRIDPNVIGPTTAGGARITVEEQLAPDFTVTYSTNTGAAQERDIQVRWDITNKISLIGERDINNVYGIEVRFRRRLR